MDRLAACHLMHGFLHVPGHRRRHATSPACQHLKAGSRSLSLADRRGLISPCRTHGRGLISSLPSEQRTVFLIGKNLTTNRYKHSRICLLHYVNNKWILTYLGHSMKKLSDMTLVMQVMVSQHTCIRSKTSHFLGLRPLLKWRPYWWSNATNEKC